METIKWTVPEVGTFDFGAGQYSPATREIARDAHRLLGLEPSLAVSAAKAAIAEFGRHLITLTPKVGKARGKDMEVTLKVISGTLKRQTMTAPLAFIRALATLNEVEYCTTIKASLQGDLADWVFGLTPAVPEPIVKKEVVKA